MTTGGQRANRRGQFLESFVGELLEDAGYVQVLPSSSFFAKRELDQPIYATQCEAGRDIYGISRRVDYILYHPRKWPQCLVIQCKWQAARGSVDQKFPYEVLTIRQNESPTIILLDGGGYSPGAEQWLRSQAGKDNLKHVFNQGELQRFMASGFL